MLKRVSGNTNTIDYSPEYPYNAYRYEGQAFTGIEYFVDREGKVMEEQSYFEGMRWGICRVWRDNGTLRCEYFSRYDMEDGIGKIYHLDGRIKEEFFAEMGIILRRKEWSKEGNLIEDFNLENEPEHSDYTYWRMRQDRKRSRCEKTNEQIEWKLEFERRAAEFEKEVAEYLVKYPSNKVYYEKDFADF
jgi:hypothetical protein